MAITLTGVQKAVLVVTAVFGLLFVNGVFIMEFIESGFDLRAVLAPGIQLVFGIESMMLLVLFCYMIYSFRLSAPGWVLFFVLSILGSMVFSIPVALLMWDRKSRRNSVGVEGH